MRADEASERGETAVGAAPRAPGATITDTGSEFAADLAVAATLAGHGAAPAPDGDLTGKTIGRYRVQTRLGAGGMGVVWAALDPALDRQVALKLLPQLAAERRAHLELRLRREAQALARLDHPNVIAVYDVGVAAESVFVAMQLIDGASLDAYLAEHRPAPRRILALFTDAARGLAAAHAAGIVHRDVKPSNLLVDRRGRLYVGDFGLARTGADELAGTSDTNLLSSEVTRAGAVLGTPLYMAPEQHAGAAATAQSDQFSLCVSLWQALFGQHPFAAGRWTEAAAIDAMRADRVVEPPRRAGVSPRIVRALRRGLRHDPAARWPSMEALLAQLAPRSSAVWIGGGAGALAIAGAVGLTMMVTAPDPSPCGAAATRLDARWSPSTRDPLLARLAQLDPSASGGTAHRTVELLDERAQRWRAAALDNCEATRVRATQPVATYERRQDCLERSAVAFEVALEQIAAVTDREQLPDTSTMARGGIDADACGVQVASRPRRLASPALVRRVAQLEAASHAGGDVSAAPALAAELEASGDEELIADVWWVIAQNTGVDSVEKQRAATRKAAEAATAIGRHEQAALAWARAAVTAAIVGDDRAVDDLLAMATAAGKLSGSAEVAQRLEIARASIDVEHREFERAAATARRVIAATEGQPLREARSDAFDILGDVLLRSHQWQELAQVTQRVEDLTRETWGPEHRYVLAPMARRGIALFRLGDRAAARALWDRVTRGLRASDGPDSVRLMFHLQDVAVTESEDGGVWSAEASAALEEAAAIARRALPADDLQRATTIAFDANRRAMTGDLAGARAGFAEVLPVYARQDDPAAWAEIALLDAALDQKNGECRRATARFHQILDRDRDGQIARTVLANARAGLASCLTLTRPDAGIAGLLAAADELAGLDASDDAVQAELTAADVELGRGRKAHARTILGRARARITDPASDLAKQVDAALARAR